ncbi:hypothetical protein EVG20_g11124, partial [Dentipellis fragilis]
MVRVRCSTTAFISSSSKDPCQIHKRLSPNRTFSTSRVQHATHYETLAIPHNATKNQIKSNFYKLSKQYHPDVNKEPGAKEKFHAVSEAYSILVDDRQRRAYDRTLSTSTTPRHPTSSHHDMGRPYGAWGYETRKRGATHAWAEHPRRRPAQGHPQDYQAYQQQRPPQPPPPHMDPFSSPHVRRATGQGHQHQHPRTGWKRTELDRASDVSTFWRAAQVIGIVAFVAILG